METTWKKCYSFVNGNIYSECCLPGVYTCCEKNQAEYV